MTRHPDAANPILGERISQSKINEIPEVWRKVMVAGTSTRGDEIVHLADDRLTIFGNEALASASATARTSAR